MGWDSLETWKDMYMYHTMVGKRIEKKIPNKLRYHQLKVY